MDILHPQEVPLADSIPYNTSDRVYGYQTFRDNQSLSHLQGSFDMRDVRIPRSVFRRLGSWVRIYCATVRRDDSAVGINYKIVLPRSTQPQIVQSSSF